jgi:DNA polymerase-1
MSIFATIAGRFIRKAAVVQPTGFRAAFDTESDGFADAATKIHCIVLVCLDSGEIFKYGPDQIEAGLAHLSRAVLLTGNNIDNHDLPLLQRLHGWKPAPDCRVIDLLVAARLILPNLGDIDKEAIARGDPSIGNLCGRYSIEAWGARFGMPKSGTDIIDWSTLTPEILQRCVDDTVLAAKVFEFLRPESCSPTALALETRANEACHQLSKAGVPFDIQMAEWRRRQWTARRAELEAPLREQFPQVKNFGSNDQLAELFESAGWQPSKRTKTGKPEIKDETLESIVKQFPQFAGIAEYKLLGSRLGALANGPQAWMTKVESDGKIRAGLLHLGQVHSRGKYVSPNLAGVPSAKKGAAYGAECRALFRCPDDRVFVCCDLAGIQDRMLAHHLAEFDDGEFARAFLGGADQHWKNVLALGLLPAGTERDKENKLHAAVREGAKTFRYGFLFGAGVGRCSEILRETVRIVQNIDPDYSASTDGGGARNRFAAATPGLTELRDKLEAHVERYQWLPGLDHRRVPCAAKYTSLNYQLVSDEAVIAKHWLVGVYDELRATFDYSWSGDVVISLWIHDEIVCCCRPAIAERVGEILKRHAVAAGARFNLRVPVDADFVVGRSWAGEPLDSPPLEIPELPPLPPMRLDPEMLERVRYWMTEREAARRHKESGEAEPHSDDPNIAGYRYTNVCREHHKQTRWFFEHVRDPFAAEPDLYFSSLIHVLVNKDTSLEQIGPPPWLPWPKVRAASSRSWTGRRLGMQPILLLHRPKAAARRSSGPTISMAYGRGVTS